MLNVPPSPGPRVGIFGGAFLRVSNAGGALAKSVGEAIANRGLIAVTGATSGLPHLASRGAIEAGGIVLGISPARNTKEHVEVYKKPLDGCTYIIFTGQGYTGRNYLTVRNCQLGIFLGGEAGTLEEYCVGVYEGLVLGALTNSGGVSELLPEIVKRFHTSHGGAFIFGTEAGKLLDEMLVAYRSLPEKTDYRIGG